MMRQRMGVRVSVFTQQIRPRLARPSGFTLIEVLLVIVVMTVITSIAVMSTNGASQRRAMQQRETLILDLARIRLESEDQARIFALQLTSKNASRQAGYQVVEFDPFADPERPIAERWKPVAHFKLQEFEPHISLSIKPLGLPNGANRQLATGETAKVLIDAPQLIWFGNGEATPALLQLSYEGKDIGGPIRINQSGLVEEN